MVLRLLITPVLLSLLSGCGKIVFPDASQYQPARANVTKHRVAKGETLYSIAYHYGVEHQTLAGWNNIGEPYPIYVGQLLTIKPQINHRVTKGETLYAIAFRYGVDYHALAITNAIKPPYRIFVGDELTVIPQANLPVAPMARSGWQDKQPTGQTAARTAPYIEPNNAQKSHKRQPKKSASYNSKREIYWGWPTRGEIVTQFSPKDHRKGIDIRGKVGNRIVAADAGDVVYSGNGLLGYGNLIIIRHNSSYLSAYGHNRRLLVKEGAKVKKGEKIAEMGDTRKKGAVLHFEIRRNGKPVNPVRYLPRS